MDEAMHPLTLLALACMAKSCPNKTAPRCAWWCHGNTVLKRQSLVRIHLSDKEPRTAWNKAAPQEYGFTPTSTPASITHAGARPASDAWAKTACLPSGARRCPLTAMKRK